MNYRLFNIFVILAITQLFLGCTEPTLEEKEKNLTYNKMLNNSSKAIQLKAVKKNPMSIMYIRNPHKDIQLAAIERNPMSIMYIKNPDINIQFATVKKNGETIKYIRRANENVQLAAVNQNGNALRYITNPHKIVQLAAVIQNKSAIKYIKNPSLEIQLAAVTKDKDAFKYINKQHKIIKLYMDAKIDQKPLNYMISDAKLSVKLFDNSTIALTNHSDKYIKINSLSEFYCNSKTTVKNLYIPPDSTMKQDAPNSNICKINSINEKVNYGFTLEYEVSGSKQIFSLFGSELFKIKDLIESSD